MLLAMRTFAPFFLLKTRSVSVWLRPGVKAAFYNCSRWFRSRFHGNHSPIIYSEGGLVSVSDKQNLVLVLYELLLNCCASNNNGNGMTRDGQRYHERQESFFSPAESQKLFVSLLEIIIQTVPRKMESLDWYSSSIQILVRSAGLVYYSLAADLHFSSSRVQSFINWQLCPFLMPPVGYLALIRRFFIVRQ